MKIVSDPKELRVAGRKVCGAIGVFDGVHLGHQEVVRRMLADARAMDALGVVITFDQHPNRVVAPSRAPQMIYPPAQKLRVLETQQIDATLQFHFDRAFSQQSAAEFAHVLQVGLGSIGSLSVGTNFSFGHHRSGNVSVLQELGREFGFAVNAVEPVMVGGKPVSSSRIREAIRLGALAEASRLLGRPYSLYSRVIQGDRLGRQLGFPTANLDVSGLQLPPFGIYAARVRVGSVEYKAAVNIGVRPTLTNPEPEVRFEAYLLDFSGDLYGAEIEVILENKIRDEQKFDSMDALKRQIAADVERVREETPNTENRNPTRSDKR